MRHKRNVSFLKDAPTQKNEKYSIQDAPTSQYCFHDSTCDENALVL